MKSFYYFLYNLERFLYIHLLSFLQSWGLFINYYYLFNGMPSKKEHNISKITWDHQAVT